MAKGQKRGNKEVKKPKQVNKTPASTPELFSKGFARDIGKPKKS